MMSAPVLDMEEEIPAAHAARDAAIRDAVLRDFETTKALEGSGALVRRGTVRPSGEVLGSGMQAGVPSPMGRRGTVHAHSPGSAARDSSPLRTATFNASASAPDATAAAAAAPTALAATTPRSAIKEPGHTIWKRAASASLMRGKLKGSGLAAKLAAQLSTSQVGVDQPLISGYNRYSAHSDGYLEGDSSPPHSSALLHANGGAIRPLGTQAADGGAASAPDKGSGGVAGGIDAASADQLGTPSGAFTAELVLSLPLDSWLPEADEPFPWMEVRFAALGPFSVGGSRKWAEVAHRALSSLDACTPPLPSGFAARRVLAPPQGAPRRRRDSARCPLHQMPLRPRAARS